MKKRHLIQFLVSQEEKDRIYETAEKYGMLSVSEFLRVAMRYIGTEQPELVERYAVKDEEEEEGKEKAPTLVSMALN